MRRVRQVRRVRQARQVRCGRRVRAGGEELDGQHARRRRSTRAGSARKRAEARAEIQLNRIRFGGADRRRAGPAARAPAASASSVSASMRTSSRPGSCVTTALARGVMSNVTRSAFGLASVLRRHTGHTEIADDHQPGRGAQFQACVVDRRERPADELDRHNPSASLADEGSGQRDEPAGGGDERLVRRQHQRLVFIGGGDGARRRVFAHLQLKKIREIVEADHLMSLHVDGREGRLPSRDRTVSGPLWLGACPEIATARHNRNNAGPTEVMTSRSQTG